GLFFCLGYGLRLIAQAKEKPMWGPRRTNETQMDDDEEEPSGSSSLTSLWTRFALYALILGVAGYGVAQSGINLATLTGISESAVGALFTAISTSLPELVTAIAAVRQGALTLAMGDIIGGNSFDVLFLAFSDMAYRQGSVYHAITQRETFLIALTILMTTILLLGLLRREKYGIANIGLESFLIIVLYLGGALFLVTVR
ncbi:MAG: sodium:calcium antiporter, partial [Leptolyngbya sp. SIO4C5]|nr:sodium:calcium antiporter [Leptolyngbya sp. SIO4C5]